MTVLVVADHDNQTLDYSTFGVISAALQLSGKIDVLIAGKHCQGVLEQAAAIKGVQTVLGIDNDHFRHLVAENLASAIAQLAASYTHVLMSDSAMGKSTLPRVAGAMGIDMVTDVVEIIADNTYKRPAYAGNAMLTIKNLECKQLLLIRASSFAGASSQASQCGIEKVACDKPSTLTKMLSKEAATTRTRKTNGADIVFAGGMGLDSKQGFHLLEEIADNWNAAVGATSAAVKRGFAERHMEIGQAGKKVAPQLYFAIGLSGSIQHVAGLKDASVIVAINKDPTAPIFSVADYGIVGDLFTTLTELDKLVKGI